MADLPDFTEVAILGGGPIGLDAALAAQELGLDFRVLESGPSVGGNIRRWGHVRLFSPWPMNLSSRMSDVLSRVGFSVPAEGEPTGQEYVDRVLEPIGSLPELSGRIHTSVTVLSVAREGLLKHQEIGSAERKTRAFRLVVREADPSGKASAERILRARIVLDCTGSRALPNAIGDGGVPAPGEGACSRLEHDIPDPQQDPSRWIRKRILVVGSGHSAQTAVVRLADLARSDIQGAEETKITWLLRSDAGALQVVEDDPLPERARLLRHAREVMSAAGGPVEVVSDHVVDGLENGPDCVRVFLKSAMGSSENVEGCRSPRHFDVIVALTGSVGDPSLYRQLQVHECYATSGPMKLAAALLSAGSGSDCLAQESHGLATLANPEPDFYILGSKSYGRTNTFLLRVGWDQVSDVFASLAPASPVG